jgi:hypothetical protein
MTLEALLGASGRYARVSSDSAGASPLRAQQYGGNQRRNATPLVMVKIRIDMLSPQQPTCWALRPGE